MATLIVLVVFLVLLCLAGLGFLLFAWRRSADLAGCLGVVCVIFALVCGFHVVWQAQAIDGVKAVAK